MDVLKRLLIAVFLAAGTAALTVPAPAVAQTITVQDVEAVIDARIAILQNEIQEQQAIIADPNSTPQDIADAQAIIDQNQTRIAQLEAWKDALPGLPTYTLQALYEYFLSLVSPNATTPA